MTPLPARKIRKRDMQDNTIREYPETRYAGGFCKTKFLSVPEQNAMI